MFTLEACLGFLVVSHRKVKISSHSQRGAGFHFMTVNSTVKVQRDHVQTESLKGTREVTICMHPLSLFPFFCLPELCTVMKLQMSALELMYINPQLLLTNYCSSQVSLSSGMSFLRRQSPPQCVQLHSW